jgi:uncharacterized protein
VDAGWLASLGLAAAVSVGAGTQRITGLGFALVAAPFLVLLLGPFTGVLVVNVLGVAASVLVLVQVRRGTGTAPELLAGAASGFVNATAAVGGPALTVYAVATRWPQHAFAATAQLCFTVVGTASAAAKGLPSLPAVDWVVTAAALVVGLGVGTLLAARVSPTTARTAALALAPVGSVATVVDGVLGA